MGDVRAFVLAIGAVLIGLGLLFGWINYKIDKLKEEDKLNIDMIGSIIALEKAMKKLNAALKIHEHRLDHERDEIYGINKRLDILEAGHPDTAIDYGTVDDDGDITEVWFEGKKYILEDNPDEDVMKLYADNKVVSETTRPEEKRCCATCRHYRPESGFSTCDLRTWLHVTKKYATMSDSACHNYEKAYAATKGEVDHLYTQYKNMGGNGRAEELPKYIIKLNYLASDAECDELLKRVERLNRIYDAGLMSLSEYGERLKEWMQNDS